MALGDADAMTNPASKSRPTIAIIGAGITGLLIAQGLKKHGFPVAVFDRDTGIDARARDWTIMIHWAIHLMESLLPADLLSRLPEAVTTPHLNYTEDVETFPCYDGRTGELLFETKMPHGRRVTRQRLRKLLFEGLEANVQWGKKLASISQPSDKSAVRLEFEDGSVHHADFVLGADGSSSAVRRDLLGPEKSSSRGSGFTFAMGVANYHDEAKVRTIVDKHPVAAMMMGSGPITGVGVMRADDPRDMASWSTFWVGIWKGDIVELSGQDAIDHVKKLARSQSELYCEPFASAIEWTPDDSVCDINEMRYWIPVPWDNKYGGRVTLAGDACHSMLPFRGQGLQMAIVDASNYLDTLIKISDHGKISDQVEGLMAAFETEMIARGAEAVRQSLAEAEKAVDPNLVDKMLMVTRGHVRLS